MDLNKQYILNYSIKNENIKSKIDLSIQLKDMYIFYLDIKMADDKKDENLPTNDAEVRLKHTYLYNKKNCFLFLGYGFGYL